MSTRTVKLSQANEQALPAVAKALGTGSEEEVLSEILELTLSWVSLRKAREQTPGSEVALRAKFDRLRAILRSQNSIDPISSDPSVMGGDACIRQTRIPVWSLVEHKRRGLTDSELLAQYPGLNAADLAASWDYYAAHGDEVDAQRARHEAA
jgi:uncharacterized protein (DUF433 family)